MNTFCFHFIAECPAKFQGAYYCWTFESANELKQTKESLKNKIGVLNQVSISLKLGNFLSSQILCEIKVTD